MSLFSKRIMTHPAFRYVFPFIVFMLFTECQRFGTPETVFYIYGAKTLATGLALFFCFKDHWKREVTGHFDFTAVFLGLIVLILWVIMPEWTVKHPLEVRFDPFVFSSKTGQWLALITRAFGAALIVPVMEELLWRSFLMRYLIRADFLAVSPGSYSPVSFWVTVVFFTLVHQTWEWPMAAVTGIFYGLYLLKTKNIFGCILAHATTNLGLAVYVTCTGKWHFW